VGKKNSFLKRDPNCRRRKRVLPPEIFGGADKRLKIAPQRRSQFLERHSGGKNPLW